MKKKGRQRQRSVLDTALRGAAAGVIGGLVVSVVEREVLTRVSGSPRHRAQWDDRAARALGSVGVRVTGGPRIAAGVTTQLLYAGVLGASYAVLREHVQKSRAGAVLLDGAFTYAASLAFPDEPRPPRRGRRLALRRKLVRPANTAAAFNRATAMALGVMLR